MAVQQLPSSRPVIRRSDAEKWLTCNAYEREAGERLAFGQAAHDFFAAYTLYCQSAKTDSALTQVERLAGEAWGRTQGLQQGRWGEFLRLCTEWAEGVLVDTTTLLGVEQTWTVDVGWALLTCTVDRVDVLDGDRDDPKAIRITDRKTEFSSMDHFFQEAWYSQVAFLRDEWPSLERVEFVIDHVRFGRGEDEQETFVRGQLDSWWAGTMAGLRAAWERRRDGMAERVGGPSCYDCALRYSCAGAIAEAAAIPETEDQADELLQDFLRLDAATKARWEGLKAFYNERDPRVVNGLEVGFLAPRDEKLVLQIDWPFEGGIRKHLELVAEAWSLAGGNPDADLRIALPSYVKAAIKTALVEQGAATLERGKPEMKTRKAEVKKA